MTSKEVQKEALTRAREGQSMTNYMAIITGFVAKGVPEDDILPRENVLTYNAWQALGRRVKKGEHGVKIVTWITCKGKEEESEDYRRAKGVTVFHVSQTEEVLK